MTHQPALFHDSLLDALAADVAAIGGVKKAAALLWPSVSDAAGRLRACLSAEHAQKFDPEEVLAIKKAAAKVNSFAALQFEAQDIGFQFQLIAPADEATSLRRELRDLLKATNQRIARLEKVEGSL